MVNQRRGIQVVTGPDHRLVAQLTVKVTLSGPPTPRPPIGYPNVLRQTKNRDQTTVPTRKPAIRRVLYLALLVLIPTTTLIGVFGFNGLYGQDAYAYYQYAIGPLRDALRSFQSPPPFFWPPGYPILVSITSFVFGTAPWVGQFVSVIAAASVPVGVYLLARELNKPSKWSVVVPRTAAILTGMTGMLWRAGVVTMSDATGIAFATFGVWAALRYRSSVESSAPGTGWCVLAAALLGGAAMTRKGAEQPRV